MPGALGEYHPLGVRPVYVLVLWLVFTVVVILVIGLPERPIWKGLVSGSFIHSFETSHCDLRVRWKVASDVRFRVAISGSKPLLSAGFLAIWLRQRGNR